MLFGIGRFVVNKQLENFCDFLLNVLAVFFLFILSLIGLLGIRLVLCLLITFNCGILK